ncbi:MAG: hypothetical protein ABSF25_10010 [Bryobacteraceae bacterium]|jgi:hypothetical protein
MNSKSQPDPASGNSRRDFFQRIGALAAASSAAAGASAAQQPPAPGAAAPGRGGPGNGLPVPGPLSKQPMPTVRFGKYDISRLIIGSNGPGAHFSQVIGLEARAWNTPERIAQQFKHCEELGINCMEDGLAKITKYNKEDGGKLLFATRNTASLDLSLRAGRGAKEIAQSGCISIHHGGAGDTGTDAWWRRGKLDRVREWCKSVRDAGVLVAVTSHRPEVFDIIESQNWDVDYYMCCLYKYGRTHDEWEKLFAFNPGLAPLEVGHPTEGGSDVYGGEVGFVRGDPPEMLKIVKQTKKPCWVYKLLACGRMAQRQDIVEGRFKEVFENIKSTDAVVVGMWDKHMDEYAINKEYVIKYGGTSIKNTGTSTSSA